MSIFSLQKKASVVRVGVLVTSQSEDGPKPVGLVVMLSNRMDMEPFPGTIRGIHLSVWRQGQEAMWMDRQMDGWAGKQINRG